ncbi:hypothetical protein IT570_10220 [Candidatus Sumerlaeota bacterium]|nr:hypothetical protein [Candidatus Sumerlaeota bacterium]
MKWEAFEPNLFPPGATLRNVVLVEPGVDDKPFLRVKDLGLRLAFRGGKIHIERANIEGVDANLVLYEKNETNLTRIVRRLFEGKNPSAPPQMVPRDNDVIPYILLSKLDVKSLNFHVSDRRSSHKRIEYDFVASEPLQLQLTKGPTPADSTGLRDRFTRITAAGDFNVRYDDVLIKTKGTFKAEVPSLEKFPNTTASLDVSLRPANGGDAQLDLSMDIPLARIPMRVKATPVQDVDLALRAPDGGEQLLHLSKTSFDPLTGEVTANLAVKGNTEQITGSLCSFVAEDCRVAVDALLKQYIPLSSKMKSEKPVEVEIAASLNGKGVAQYGIVDESERVPLQFTTSGSVATRNMPLETLSRFEELLARAQGKQEEPKTFISDLRYTWNLTADEALQKATLRADMEARPAGAQDDNLLFSMSLVDADDPSKPVTFDPFRMGAWDWRPPSLEDVQAKVPIYPVFPNYEQFTAEMLAYLNRGTEAINALGLESAAVRQKISIKDNATLVALLSPLVGCTKGAARGEVEVKATRRGRAMPSEWSADVRVDDVRLEGMNDLIGVEGNLGFVREGEVLTASALELKLRRQAAGGTEPIELSMSLPRTTRDGSMGPVTPTYINLATGEAHFEVSVSTIRREFMEILMRIQTFDLSRHLASPLYQHILSVLGFRPGDERANGEADVYLAGDIGETVRVGSLVKVRNIPASSFIESPMVRQATKVEEFDARFSQAFSLNRVTKLLSPEEFQLELFAPGRDSAFARLDVETTENTSLDYPMLQEIATDDVQRIEAGGLQAQSLKALAATIFTRTARLKKALRGEGGRILFSLPGVQLREWQHALNAAGIPIESGVLKMELAAELTAAGSGDSETKASGHFALADLKLLGSMEIIPQVQGTLDVSSADDVLSVRNFATELKLDPAFPPTKISFDGSADVNTFASQWRLSVAQVNRSALNVLRSLSDSGVGIATNVLSRLPAGQLGEIAGSDANVHLQFAVETPATGEQVSVKATQSGEGIDFLPAVFNPLSFRSEEEFVYTRENRLTIGSLRGEITERDTPSPLLTFVMERPEIVDAESNAPSTVTIRAQKSLTDIAQRLARFPLPFFRRTVKEGQIEGDVVIHLPTNVAEVPSQSLTDFRLALTGLKLDGYDKAIDGMLSGRLENDAEFFKLTNSTLETRVGGQDAGRLELSSVYAVKTRNLESTIDAIDVNSRLLEALPPDMAIWARQPSTRLNLHGEFDAGLDDNAAGVTLQARVRDFGLPPTKLDTGETIVHPTLNLDLALTSAFDRDTSTLLLQDFSALIAKGSYPSNGRMDALPEDARAIFRVTQLGTIVFDAGRRIFASNTATGAGLRAELGPVDLAEYGIALRRLAGIPLTKGVLTGEATVAASGIGPTRVESGHAQLRLSYGAWEKSSGEKIPIEAHFEIQGGHREGALRLDGANLEVTYPDAKDVPAMDSLAGVGFYAKAGLKGRREFELDLTSPGMQLERVIAMVADIQRYNTIAYEPETEGATAKDEPPRYELSSFLPKNLKATITGRFDNMAYKEVKLPDVTLKGSYRDGVVSLDSLRSQVSEGEISMTGGVDLRTRTPKWHYVMNMANVEARPWVNSLARTAYHDRISGKLSAKAFLEGSGFDGKALADTIRADLSVSLRDGKFEDDRIGKFVGDESDIGADVRVLARDNRAIFRLDTPWNPSRDLLFQGVLRPLVPEPGGMRYLMGTGEATRMTAVGPRGRNIEYKGDLMPFRQPIAGILFEVEGAVGRNFSPKIRVRSVNY